MARRSCSRTLSVLLSAFLLSLQSPSVGVSMESVPARLPGGESKAAATAAPKTRHGVVRPEGLVPAIGGIAGAVPLPPSPVSGAIDYTTHHEDVYEVAVSSPKRLAVVLTGQSSLDADVYVFGPSATAVDPSAALCSTLGDEFPKSVVLDVPAGAEGVYYVVVYGWSGSGSYELEWRIVDPAGEADDDVPGAPLTAMPSTQSTAGALAWPADIDDVYAIPIADGQRLVVELDGPAAADYDVRLFAPGTPSVIGSAARFGASGPSADEWLVHDVLAGEGGTWYLDVRSATCAGAYTLRWQVVDVPPGTWESIGSPTSYLGQSGYILESLSRMSDPNDVYGVHLDAGKRLVMRLDGADGTDFDIYLYSVDGSQVIAFDEDGTYPDRLLADITATGMYFVEVRAFSGDGLYALDWRVIDTPVFSGCARDAGRDRYETAIEVSKATFPAGSVETVVLASGEVFPDALAAGGLAGCYGSPVLLTRKSALPDGFIDEIARLGANSVVIVGGTGVVTDDVKSALTKAGLAVDRVAGLNRYQTARAVAARIRALTGDAFSGIAFMARGDDFADALAVGPCAYALKAPVLLTTPTSLHADARAAITENGIDDVYIAGGAGAVSEGVRQAIQPLVARPVVRLAGQDRFGTAAAVADYATKMYWLEEGGVLVATGSLFPDALGGGAAAGERGYAVLLTRTTSLPEATSGYLAARKGTIVEARIAGGTGAVSDQVKAAIEKLLR